MASTVLNGLNRLFCRLFICQVKWWMSLVIVRQQSHSGLTRFNVEQCDRSSSKCKTQVDVMFRYAFRAINGENEIYASLTNDHRSPSAQSCVGAFGCVATRLRRLYGRVLLVVAFDSSIHKTYSELTCQLRRIFK